jgi:S1-C subfamily serine protease
MTRRLAVALVLLLPVVAAAEDKPKPKRAWIGVQIRLDEQNKAVVITAILPNGPAEKAGLKANDVLVRINGVKPADLQAAVRVIGSLKVGKKVKFEIKRDGKEKTIDVIPVDLEE